MCIVTNQHFDDGSNGITDVEDPLTCGHFYRVISVAICNKRAQIQGLALDPQHCPDFLEAKVFLPQDVDFMCWECLMKSAADEGEWLTRFVKWRDAVENAANLSKGKALVDETGDLVLDYRDDHDNPKFKGYMVAGVLPYSHRHTIYYGNDEKDLIHAAYDVEIFYQEHRKIFEQGNKYLYLELGQIRSADGSEVPDEVVDGEIVVANKTIYLDIVEKFESQFRATAMSLARRTPEYFASTADFMDDVYFKTTPSSTLYKALRHAIEGENKMLVEQIDGLKNQAAVEIDVWSPNTTVPEDERLVIGTSPPEIATLPKRSRRRRVSLTASDLAWQLPCRHCGEEFDGEGDFSDHEKICDKNPFRLIYTCRNCFREFRTSTDRDLHKCGSLPQPDAKRGRDDSSTRGGSKKPKL